MNGGRQPETTTSAFHARRATRLLGILPDRPTSSSSTAAQAAAAHALLALYYQGEEAR